MGFILILLSPLVTTPANAALFYTGGVSIDSLSATIDVTSEAEITIEYDLVNYGDTVEEINITCFPQNATVRIDGNELLNPVDFQPGTKRKLSLSYSIDLPAAEFQRIIFDPMVLLNDLASSQRLKSYDVRLMLPEGVKRIIDSSMDYDDTDSGDGRLFILWEKQDLYPISLTVAWTTLDVNIAAVKKATPSSLTAPGEIIEVEVTIQNNGDEEVRDIILIDSFFPGTFEAISPSSEFELVESEMSDPHLYWKKEIDSLKSGETKTCTYSVRVSALSMETRLDSLSVLVGGIPVSVSNDIILYSELGERYPDEAPDEAVGGCFIATAAYGTPMAEEIDVIRDFRDQYLLTNPVGEVLVDLYYEVSPPMAEFINEHPSLKPIVRAGLVPAVAMSTVVVNTSPAEKAAIIGLLVLISVALAVWATRRRGRGPQYT